MKTHAQFLATLTLSSLFALAACSSSEDPASTGDGDGDGDGDNGSGGVVDGGTGGGTATGGADSGTGGGTSSGGAMGGAASGGAASGGSSMGGMGGETSETDKPSLVVTLDDVESYTLLDAPESSGWTKWDPTTEISDDYAQSGTKSVKFFDNTGTGDTTPEAPELQRSYSAVGEGVFQGSIFVVPQTTTNRPATFTIYSESSSSAFRLADFRFDGDGSVRWRDSAAGSWVALDGVTFATNTWVDIEIAWNSSAGTTGQVWLTVGDQELDPIDLYASTPSQIFGIKLGDNDGKDDTAAMYLDDFGLALGL